MKKKKKYTITKKELNLLKGKSIRKDKVDQGVFDGRYAERSIPDKKKQANKRSCRNNSKDLDD